VLAIAAEDHHAVVRHQAGIAPRQRLDDGVGKFLGAEGGVVGAAHIRAAETRHHVVEGGNALLLAGQRRGEGRMRMHHGAGLRPRGIDVAMEAPFGGRLAPAARRAVSADSHHVVGAAGRVGHAGGRDDERRHPAQRALTLPALPRLMPEAFIARAVARTCSASPATLIAIAPGCPAAATPRSEMMPLISCRRHVESRIGDRRTDRRRVRRRRVPRSESSRPDEQAKSMVDSGAAT
jgi:hypothetical protein